VTERTSLGEPAASTAPAAAIEQLRRVGKIEGVSFLVLLGIAMPLKYFAGLPLAVKLVGWVHGVLFIWFMFTLWRAKSRAGLSLGELLPVFIAALLPFGPFVIDRRLERQAEARSR
jgi:integral membrane protein